MHSICRPKIVGWIARARARSSKYVTQNRIQNCRGIALKLISVCASSIWGALNRFKRSFWAFFRVRSNPITIASLLFSVSNVSLCRIACVAGSSICQSRFRVTVYKPRVERRNRTHTKNENQMNYARISDDVPPIIAVDSNRSVARRHALVCTSSCYSVTKPTGHFISKKLKRSEPIPLAEESQNRINNT